MQQQLRAPILNYKQEAEGDLTRNGASRLNPYRIITITTTIAAATLLTYSSRKAPFPNSSQAATNLRPTSKFTRFMGGGHISFKLPERAFVQCV